MPLYWIVLLVVGISASLMSAITHQSEELSRSTDITAIARNMLIYRSALAEYAYNNATVAGEVNDSVLNLPSWFVHLPGVNGYVAAGTSYTFYSSPPNGLVTELASITDSSSAVGYVVGGQLVVPAGDTTGITIPAAIPNGSAVAYR